MSEEAGNGQPPVGLASVGLGWWGAELAKGVARSGAGRVVACFARNPDRRQAFAADHDCLPADSFEALLADDAVEGLVVATPHSTHLPIIRAAAEAGKHVFMEKPLAISVAEAREAVEIARAAGIVLQVGHHRRRVAATRALRERIDREELGLVHLLETRMFNPADLEPRPGWRSDPEESPLGGMTALGVHMIDNIHYLAGRIAEVHAYSRQLLARGTLDDMTTLSMELESGALATLTTSLILPKSITVAAFGTGGSAWSEADGEELYVQPMGEPNRSLAPLDPVDPVADQMRELAACIREGATPEVDGEQALEVVAVLEAARISVANRAPTPVTPVREGELSYA